MEDYALRRIEANDSKMREKIAKASEKIREQKVCKDSQLIVTNLKQFIMKMTNQ